MYLTYIIGLAAKLFFIWKTELNLYSTRNIEKEKREYEGLSRLYMPRGIICDSIKSWIAMLILKKGEQSDEPEGLSPS
ncbi:hypothetical protein AF332_17560 [Sporosarcina globispora]|uniref:Uncharacterized protein n=1 Tax=Sporosarcina globispora TaxID=1459 RepID=A0A0M0GF25_SPOGL|nr:hypothetical protein AF332_17560 [Sporosarcina globispora]